MTEEQKQALIEWLKEGIELREEYGFNGNLLASMRVALAALTAPEDWKQRAEAEAKLAELAQQKPIGWLNDAYLGRGVIDGEVGEDDFGPGYIPIYRQPFNDVPAPAADLAELVPGEMFMSDTVKASLPTEWMDGFNACRATILRNIKEAK